jgi:hypothetical protein
MSFFCMGEKFVNASILGIIILKIYTNIGYPCVKYNFSRNKYTLTKGSNFIFHYSQKKIKFSKKPKGQSSPPPSRLSRFLSGACPDVHCRENQEISRVNHPTTTRSTKPPSPKNAPPQQAPSLRSPTRNLEVLEN